MRFTRQIPTSPTLQDSRALNGLDSDRPCEAGCGNSQPRSDLKGRDPLAATTALEGTVLRVPCLSSRRGRPPNSQAACCCRRGFWRSSVRSRGPPAANCSRFSERRRRAWDDRLADDSTVGSLWQRPDPFALRVARPSARTRCGPSIAKCSTGVRGKASPPVGNAGEESAPIPVLTANLCDIGLMTPEVAGTSKPRLGTTWDDCRRPRRPRHTNGVATLSLIAPSKPVATGRSNRVLGRFQTSPTSQDVPGHLTFGS